MTESAHIILQKAREKHEPKMQQWRLAQRLSVCEEQVKRWENGRATPDPDMVYKIGKELGDDNLWHQWMLAQYDSYRERYAVPADQNSAYIKTIREAIQQALDKIPKGE